MQIMSDDNTIDLLKIKIERAKEQLPIETLNAIAAVDWKAAILALRERKGYSFEQLGDLETETELVLCGLVSSTEYPKELQHRMNISKAEVDELVQEMNVAVFSKIKEELIKNTERKKIFQKKNAEEARSMDISPVPPVSINTPPPVIDKVDAAVLQKAGIEVDKVVDIDKPAQDIFSTGGISTAQLEPARNASSIADAGGENREELLKKIENPEPPQSLLAQKLSNTVQTPTTTTDHVLDNISKPNTDTHIPVVEKSIKTKIDPYREIPE